MNNIFNHNFIICNTGVDKNLEDVYDAYKCNKCDFIIYYYKIDKFYWYLEGLSHTFRFTRGPFTMFIIGVSAIISCEEYQIKALLE